MEKCGKKRKMMKNGLMLLKKAQLMKNENNNIFSLFSEKYGKCRKKWKMIKMCQILMKKVTIDEKWKK